MVGGLSLGASSWPNREGPLASLRPRFEEAARAVAVPCRRTCAEYPLPIERAPAHRRTVAEATAAGDARPRTGRRRLPSRQFSWGRGEGRGRLASGSTRA